MNISSEYRKTNILKCMKNVLTITYNRHKIKIDNGFCKLQRTLFVKMEARYLLFIIYI